MDAEVKRYIDQQIYKLKKELLSVINGKKNAQSSSNNEDRQE